MSDKSIKEIRFLHNAAVKKALKDFPLMLKGDEKSHVAIFRMILEVSQTHGRWSGRVAQIS